MSERMVDTSPHRFFRAMVLMGSGIALGCGGLADGASSSGGAAGSSATGSSGGTGATGGSGAGSGGSVADGGTTTGIGGTTTAAGGSTTGVGGTGTSGGTGGGAVGGGTGGTAVDGSGGTYGGTGGTAPGSTCSPSQWSCPGALQCGMNEVGDYTLPDDCICDPSRPLSGADCPSGTRVCLQASSTVNAARVPTVPFMCECAADPSSCDAACHLAFPDGDGHRCSDIVPKILPPPDPVPVNDDILCGCSFVYLR